MALTEIPRTAYHRLAAETLLDLRTIRKAYEGGSVVASVRLALERAAEALNLPPPPPATERRRAT